ncbi:PEPxxWA-CTERM sorting domain-containing protein [uncultured Phenylobacterium sp.]|uniref:PEPxxWA-CTERM sorting domain-containing protein n=1 Tax=uncultured Phenylobacterium sp. TaxID=349273 RepID=UPI0025DE39DE|nr:PEPxxWA-CTERM sorting domain-containing protein [uncultured Phenylobacterium sp.]
MRRYLLGALAALAVGGSASAADYFVLDVAGTAMPWLWEDGGLNTDYQFGTQDGSGPAVFDFSNLGIGAGDSYGILFVGGLTSAFATDPVVNNNGYNGDTSPVFLANGDPGASGMLFPSAYLYFGERFEDDPMDDPDLGPILVGYEDEYLNALVGAFTDSTGSVVSPFSLGTTYSGLDRVPNGTLFGFSASLGAGITHVQFGLNDDIFADNTGSLQVCVDRGDDSCFRQFYGGGAGPVPEPAAWAMMIAGFGLSGAMLRRRRTLFA